MRTNLIGPIVILASLLLAGCAKEATGQVAAIVNGEEITLQEINAEVSNSQIPEGADPEITQQAALQRIIDRRLMAQAAREEGLDNTPDFLIRERQLEETLLAQLHAQKAERSAAVPEQAEIDRFILENSSMFGERVIFSVDRIQFPFPGDLGQLDALEDDHSMAEVVQTLNRLNIQFQRSPGQIDSLRLGSERSERILALPDGEPFVIPENGVVTIAAVISTETMPITGAEARPIALQTMRGDQIREILLQRLQSERGQAEIEYQTGFAPAGEAIEETAQPS